jgi:Chlorophyllase enzyme
MGNCIRSRSAVTLTLIGLGLAASSCGSGTTPGGTPLGTNNQGTSSGSLSGSGGGQNESSSGGSSGTTSSGGGSSSGNTSSGSSGGTPAPTTDGGGGADGAGGGDSGPASVGVNCKSADFSKACSSFTTPTGTTIQLGPYGAILDPNVGKGFENTVQTSDMGTQPSSQCQTFANLFMENANLTTLLLTTTMNGVTTDFALYSVYRPAVWPDKPVPVITWGNGTCAQPEGYGALLRYVASYGYFVVAANDRQVGTADTTGTGSTQPMLRALDYAAAANMDSTSPYYQKLDMTKVGAMGHSQGGAATVTAASDSRIKDIIIFNASDSASKPFLAISGDMDITGFSVAGMTMAVNSATVPGAFLFYHNPTGASGDSLKGHLVLMLTPERVTTPTVAWWEWLFRADAASKAQFLPASTCGLCTHSSDYVFGANTMLK